MAADRCILTVLAEPAIVVAAPRFLSINSADDGGEDHLHAIEFSLSGLGADGTGVATRESVFSGGAIGSSVNLSQSYYAFLLQDGLSVAGDRLAFLKINDRMSFTWPGSQGVYDANLPGVIPSWSYPGNVVGRNSKLYFQSHISSYLGNLHELSDPALLTSNTSLCEYNTSSYRFCDLSDDGDSFLFFRNGPYAYAVIPRSELLGQTSAGFAAAFTNNIVPFAGNGGTGMYDAWRKFWALLANDNNILFAESTGSGVKLVNKTSGAVLGTKTVTQQFTSLETSHKPQSMAGFAFYADNATGLTTVLDTVSTPGSLFAPILNSAIFPATEFDSYDLNGGPVRNGQPLPFMAA